jgi:hypothetical protein
MLFLVKNSLAERKCEMMCCRDATASYSVAKVQGEVFTFSRIHRKALQWYAEMTVQPARMNSL